MSDKGCCKQPFLLLPGKGEMTFGMPLADDNISEHG